MEMATKNTEVMSQPAIGSVNVVSKGQRYKPRKSKHWGTERSHSDKAEGTNSDSGKRCFRCGGKHTPADCKFLHAQCYVCQKEGHIGKKCPTKRSKGPVSGTNISKTKYLEAQELKDDEFLYGLYNVASVDKGYKVNLNLNGCPVQMEIDTGAAITICSEKVYTDHLSQLSLQKPTVKLKDYGGVNVPLRGEVTVPVTYGNQSHNLLLRVACGNRPSLLGRNWLSHIKLDWPIIFTVTQSVQSQRIDTSVKELLVKHHKLFQKGLGTIQKFKAHVKVRSDVQPIFCKARAVPFSLKETLEKELHRLENEGIVSRVEQSDWATPVVIVPKADKSIRLCGDFKVTVNKCLDEQQYPLPNVEDMFAQLAGGQKFTKLDLSKAYQQLTLDEASGKYLTITTHLGLFKYHRLPLGVASAPAIFQSVMDQILQGVPHTMCCIDDILVTAPSDSEHIKILGEVLRRLEEHHVRLREDKCKFMEDTVKYMGHMVDREGIHPTEAKIEAIKNAPSPTNVSELKSFLGLLNYYCQYMPNLSTKLQPLHELLRQDTSWNWTLQCECAFRSCKDQL
ncbi:uncharacterized protein K02A2.6-like [Ylistrum balloti]|uniref:uncharacterized protein K02A2.6-like n=1 Tax=Ylistrum balloti TaxID=509963 RepID=UPI002905C545|nr:uncharacterized protein K02A2.6-like [Ylistrum balloti]